MIVSLQTVAPYVQSGKLRMLAVMSGERSEAFPDVPTLKELGLPDLEVDTWYGVFAPAGTSGTPLCGSAICVPAKSSTKRSGFDKRVAW